MRTIHSLSSLTTYNQHNTLHYSISRTVLIIPCRSHHSVRKLLIPVWPLKESLDSSWSTPTRTGLEKKMDLYRRKMRLSSLNTMKIASVVSFHSSFTLSWRSSSAKARITYSRGFPMVVRLAFTSSACSKKKSWRDSSNKARSLLSDGSWTSMDSCDFPMAEIKVLTTTNSFSGADRCFQWKWFEPG